MMTNVLRRTIRAVRAGMLRKRALRTIAGMRESGEGLMLWVVWGGNSISNPVVY